MKNCENTSTKKRTRYMHGGCLKKRVYAWKIYVVALLFLATISFSHAKKNINKGRTNQKNKKVLGIVHNLYYTGP
jgi:hypothetical protein